MSEIELKPYDSADYLKSEEAQNAYLRLAVEEAAECPELLPHALGVVARARNTSQVAKAAGLSRAGLYKATREGASPSYETVVKLARALGVTIRPEIAPG